MPLCEVAVIVVTPSPTAVTTPVSETVATFSSLLSQAKSLAVW